MLNDKPVRLIAHNLFFLFIAVYLFTISGLNFYFTDASELRVEVIKSIIDRFDVTVPDNIGIKGVDGRAYSWLGIGPVILSIPFYLAGKYLGVAPESAVIIVNPLFSAATVVMIFLFTMALGYSRRTSSIIGIFYGLGTLAWPLAKQPFDHPLETFFVLASIYNLYCYTVNKKLLHLAISSISLGIAFMTRYTSLLMLPPLFLMLAAHYRQEYGLRVSLKYYLRDAVVFAAVLLPFISLILWYNHYRFGSVLETGYSLYASRTGLEFFKGTPLWRGVGGFLISPGKGFFYYSPIAILFFFSVKAFFKRHSNVAFCFILTIVFYLLFLSKNIYWHGDWAWGPRYLSVITPFLIIPIAEQLDSSLWSKKQLMRRLTAAIFIISLGIQLAAVSVYFKKYFLTLFAEENISFTFVEGHGTPTIIEPPPETYFDCRMSPIVAQFKFIYKMAGTMKKYTYHELPSNSTAAEQIAASPFMNVFDFWWLYHYFIYNDYSGFPAAFALLLLAVLSARRIVKIIL